MQSNAEMVTCSVVAALNKLFKTRKNALETSMLSISLAIRGMIMEMDTVCDSTGCGWSGTLTQFDSHKLLECHFAVVKCGFFGCDIMLPRHDIQSHVLTCPFRIVLCDYCGGSQPHNKLSTHLTFCKHRPVSCPNNCGQQGLQHRDLAEHLNTACPLQMIPCTYFYKAACGPSCTGTVLRQDCTEHKTDRGNMAAAIEQLMVLTERLQDENSRMRQTAELSATPAAATTIRRSGAAVSSSGRQPAMNTTYVTRQRFDEVVDFSDDEVSVESAVEYLLYAEMGGSSTGRTAVPVPVSVEQEEQEV